MASVVEQIQSEAVDGSVPVPQLLRRVKLAAVKLGLGKTATWVEAELNGYDDKKLPDYRHISGIPKVLNPARGWIHVGGPPQVQERLSRVDVQESVSSLESLIQGADGEFLVFPYPPGLMQIINQSAPYPWPQGGAHVERSSIVALLDRVRGRVLDWAIELEEAGIKGEGVSFTPDERKRASALTVKIENFTGNFHQGEISGHAASLSQSTGDNRIRLEAAPVFEELRALIATTPIGQHREALEDAAADMERSVGTAGFLTAYQSFMAAASDHITVLAPVIPMLTALLGHHHG